MIVQSARRPLGCWKTLVRQSRQQKMLLMRSMATEAAPTSAGMAAPMPPPPPPKQKKDTSTIRDYRYHAIKSYNPSKPVRTAFAVYQNVPSARKHTSEPLERYHARQIRRLDKTGARTSLFSKKNPDAARPGDVLQVTTKKGGEPFAGVCLSIRRAGIDTAILLRNHLTKLGVEMWFKIYNPAVQGIEIVWRRPRRARRARLFFMRQPKHDKGNVDHLVDTWRRTRNVFTSKGKKSKAKAKAQK